VFEYNGGIQRNLNSL